MDFEKNKEGFFEEESKGNVPSFPYSPYSSSVRGPANFGNGTPWDSQFHESHHHHEGVTAPKIDFMEVGSSCVEREHMFDKVVTPSDVGKLNRLVIPKQYAEKYFPLDSSTNEKGLLLNFEDRNGKPWRFRYSYWNSSQSYVMTKGWSRFVKEKRLDAGDIVSFQRGIGELGKDGLYIDYRRRTELPEPPYILNQHSQFGFQQTVPFSPLLMRPAYVANVNNNNYSYGGGYGNVMKPVYYMTRGGLGPQIGQGGVEPTVFNSVPVVHGKAAAKRLRLFGVNMECPVSNVDDECDILSSTMVSPQSSPHLQLRLYDGIPVPAMPPGLMNKGKNTMSLDLDM